MIHSILVERVLAGLLAAIVLAACGAGGGAGASDAAPDDDAEADGPDDAEVEEDADEEQGPCEAAEPSVETAVVMDAGRYAPIAVGLDGGSVLIAGGYDFDLGIQPSAGIFDPASSTLSPAGSLRTGRNFASWVTLETGEVLVVGGFHPAQGSLSLSEIWDGAFAAGASTTERREALTATLLPDGRVLAAGGLSAVGFVFHASAEIYDPATGEFAPAGDMDVARAFHAAALLPSGSVLVVGGDSGAGELHTAEIFDPASGAFEPVASTLSRPAKAPTATVLPDGRVLVAGGANAVHGTLDLAWIFDPADSSFEETSPMHVRRMAHAAVLLPDGRVLVAGGWSDTPVPSASTPSIEIFDPSTREWELVAVELSQPRHDLVLVPLPGCRVLVVGGQQSMAGEPPVAPVEIEIVTVPAEP